MNSIYQDAKDKYVTGVIFYADGSKKLYEDEAGSVAATSSEAFNAFLKGVLVIKDGNAFLRATKIAGTTVSVGADAYTVEA